MKAGESFFSCTLEERYMNFIPTFIHFMHIGRQEEIKEDRKKCAKNA
ncbi:hypothetical protein [Geoglobus acetivorans]|uniref:Uncharacterized protein n=1 Tax=Geoglobus acetivorans TaxID=565033 RepID=A0A0A7GC52_GEOAI|nr:hypothetical protein GACE_0341 [Geoglobus acetivorans]